MTSAGSTAAPPASSPFWTAIRTDPTLRSEAWRRRSASEKARLAVEIALTYAGVRRLVRRRRLEYALAALRAGAGDPAVAAATAATYLDAVRLGWAVGRTLRVLPGDTRCLTQSLVLTRLLARRGIGSTLVIAVSPGADFAAHAWLEHGAEPVLPAEDAGFGRLIEL